jgi:hypothetical protein
MRQHRPGKNSCAVLAVLTACFAVCIASDASAQAANSLNLSGNLSGMPLSPSLFQHSAPAPLTPDPGGAFTSPAASMPVPPLARATLPTAENPAPDTQATAEHDDGSSHAALDDTALDRVR